MTRFLHTSDWQMGMAYAHAGHKAKELRRKRMEAAERAAAIARKQRVDFVLLAGDTFEHHDVDDTVVRRTVEVLNQLAPTPVFVLPGNHDPWVPGGVWSRSSWKGRGEHVVLCSRPQSIDLPGGAVLYPCPLTQKESRIDPTQWIPARQPGDQRIRIGLAHGSLNVLSGPLNFPIDRRRPQVSGLDYLALGDWHSFAAHGRSVYCGTIEPTKFAEHDCGQVVIVDIAAHGQEPAIDRAPCNATTWLELSPGLHDLTDVEALRRRIGNAASDDALVLRVAAKLEADAPQAVAEAVEALEAELTDRVFLLDWNVNTAATGPSDAESPLPDGILAGMDEALAEIVDGRRPLGAGAAFAGESPEIAGQARVLLRRLAREAGR